MKQCPRCQTYRANSDFVPKASKQCLLDGICKMCYGATPLWLRIVDWTVRKING